MHAHMDTQTHTQKNPLKLTEHEDIQVPQKLKSELSYDPAETFLHRYTIDFKSAYHRDTCKPVFIAILLKISM